MMSSLIDAASAFVFDASGPTTIEDSMRIQVPFGLARLVTMVGSGLRVEPSECLPFGGFAAASDREPPWSAPPSTCMPNRPPAPTAKHVRIANSATNATTDAFFGGGA